MPAPSTGKFFDREKEREIFDDLLKLEDAARLLTICDSGGRGKSALLECLQSKCEWPREPQLPVSRIELDKLPDNQPFTFIDRLVSHFRQGDNALAFPQFAQKNDARVRKDFTPFAASAASIEGKVFLEQATLGGSANTVAGVAIQNPHVVHVNAAPAWASPEQEEIAREACVEAFFADLKNACATQLAVLLLDSWENCNEDLRKWCLRKLVQPNCLNLDQRPAKFVVVLAGRKVPEFAEILGPERYLQLVRAVKALGPLEEHHVKDILAAHGYEELDDSEVQFLCKKLNMGWSLNKVFATAKQFLEDENG